MLSEKFGVSFFQWGVRGGSLASKIALAPLLAPQLIRKTINA